MTVQGETTSIASALIAIDWGTSALRGWLLSHDGQVLDRRASAHGIMAVPGGDFDTVYRAFTADWRTTRANLPALAAGMIGSRQGWVEAPYVACPADFADLADRCVTAGARDVSLKIVPGLSWQAPDAMTDVMRGEETQLLGALADGEQDGLFILPGTHSKWARVEAGRVVAFATYMTGELFALLRAHSILGRMMAADGAMTHDATAFARGACDGLSGGGDLLRRLFGVRTQGLFGVVTPDAAPSVLSGLLIGAEVAAARAAGKIGHDASRVVLIGETTLCQRYADVLRLTGVDARQADSDVTPRGLWRLARAAGMIG